MVVRSLSLTEKPAHGSVFVTATSEEAVDGGGLLRGRVGAEEIDVLLLSQSKWREVLVPETGEPSERELFKTNVNELVLKMRAVGEKLKAKWMLGGPRVITVYDVFTDRVDPKRPIPSYALERDEVLFVTRMNNYKVVVGEALAARQRVREA